MDRSLATLLRSLQTSISYEDASRLLPTATSLLTQLTNPLNLTLLASQLLTNDHLFPRSTDLALCRRIFGIFYTAALRLVEDQTLAHLHRLSANAWAKAVIQGADEKSPRWRHVILIGGILLGLEGQKQERLSSTLRAKIESALVTASNLALEDDVPNDQTTGFCVIFVLNHTFVLLSDAHRAQLRYDLFLPLAVDATFFSREGLDHGYWLGLIDKDVKETVGKKFNWSPKSATFRRLQEMKSKALLSSLGPLSRLIAHSVDNVDNSVAVVNAVERVSDFARILAMSWKQNKLSEVDVAEEGEFLDSETLRTTMLLLWQTLREIFFAIIVFLRAVLGRLLCDPVLSTNTNAPLLAMLSLHTMRYLNFIGVRLGQTATSQYLFVNFTAIDILNQFPAQAESFLQAIRPSNLGSVSAHPLERSDDLFFMNTAEHFVFTINSNISEELLLAAAMPYVTAAGGRRSGEVYEAAHSVLLAVFAAPHNSDLAMRHLPFYVELLLQSFPQDLSPRQLRLAIKSILRIVAPPSLIANTLPLLSSIILELIHEKANTASDALLPTSVEDPADSASGPPLSEQSALILALIDGLPYLPPITLEEWLPLTASLINRVTDPTQKSVCHKRFWEVLSSGEMDMERAAVCVAWWTTRGGRELTLFDDHYVDDEDDYMMTGALHDSSRL